MTLSSHKLTLFPYTTLFRSLALAPGASKVIVYEGPNSDAGVIDTYNRMATDNLAKQLSTSWGLDEGSTGASIRNAENTILDRKSTRLNSSHTVISYAVFCLK